MTVNVQQRRSHSQANNTHTHNHTITQSHDYAYKVQLCNVLTFSPRVLWDTTITEQLLHGAVPCSSKPHTFNSSIARPVLFASPTWMASPRGARGRAWQGREAPRKKGTTVACILGGPLLLVTIQPCDWDLASCAGVDKASSCKLLSKQASNLGALFPLEARSCCFLQRLHGITLKPPPLCSTTGVSLRLLVFLMHPIGQKLLNTVKEWEGDPICASPLHQKVASIIRWSSSIPDPCYGSCCESVARRITLSCVYKIVCAFTLYKQLL